MDSPITTAEPASGEHGHHVRTVHIVVNNTTVSVPEITTGAGIKQAAGIDPAWQLFRIKGDQEIAVADNERIRVHKKDKFVATPPLDPS